MAVRSTNTYQEGLQSLIQDIASLQLVPDANVDFLLQLQQAIISEAQAPLQAQAMMASGPGNAGPVGPVAGPPPGAPVGGPPPGLAQLLGAGGPGNGSAPLPQSPAADELARMMA